MNVCDILNHIEIIGNGEVIIDGADSVVELTDSMIEIKQKGYNLRVSGDNLKIAQFTDKYIIISGTIFSVEFLYD